jgi:hypothetical protein
MRESNRPPYSVPLAYHVKASSVQPYASYKKQHLRLDHMLAVAFSMITYNKILQRTTFSIDGILQSSLRLK